MTENDSCCPEWANQLKPVGLHYFGGLVQDAESLLELHSRSTMCTFGTRTSVTKLSRPMSDENQPLIAESVSKVSTR